MKKVVSFCTDFVTYLFRGGPKYWVWLGFLWLFIFGWMYGNYQQLTQGMIVTGLTDQVSWGLYLANFVFLVGVAAGAVTVVFPAYVYKHKPLHEVTVLGEMLAIAAVIMCMLFVLNHMGRPDRLWHMMPIIGIYNFPGSMLSWDVIVLLGYLTLNIVGGFYYLYKKYTGEPLNNRIYLPVIYVAMVWALSIHTVTAFFINTMPARPMWHHGMMPIRFISTAFAAGPALIIIVFSIVRNNTKLWIEDKALDLLSQIVVWCMGIALFLTLSETVTEFYHPTEHSLGLQYLMFGHNGLNGLVAVVLGIVTRHGGCLCGTADSQGAQKLPNPAVDQCCGIPLHLGGKRHGFDDPGIHPDPHRRIHPLRTHHHRDHELSRQLGHRLPGAHAAHKKRHRHSPRRGEVRGHRTRRRLGIRQCTATELTDPSTYSLPVSVPR